MNSDYKNKRVHDPTKISSKQEKQVKKYVKDFFDKAVAKREQHDRNKAERRAKDAKESTTATPLNDDTRVDSKDGDEDVKVDLENIKMEDDIEPEDEIDNIKQELSPLEEEFKNDESSADLKRKRDNNTPPTKQIGDIDITTPKKIKSETETPPPPPPPPPPPMEDVQDDAMVADVRDQSVSMDTTIFKQAQDAEDLSASAGDDLLQANRMGILKIPINKLNGESHSSSRQKINGVDGVPSPMQLATPPVSGPFGLEKNNDQQEQVNDRKAAQEVTVANS